MPNILVALVGVLMLVLALFVVVVIVATRGWDGE